MIKKNLFFLLFLIIVPFLKAQVAHPYSLHYFLLNIENKKVQMVYMNVQPVTANDKIIILLQGKNFNGYFL